MVPILELHESILYSQILQLSLLEWYIVAIIGKMLPIPFIFLFVKKNLSNKHIIHKFFT
ncbi:small multi-drug export protein [Clostridium botulinum]|uniref:Small multi-drug export protein n=1 Tax=Clostridium botulinum TaxID=1491 RepID=A0ABD7CEW4_CLOBO|nr:small multi-drug export protein [Clostridium botulinum]